MNAKSASAAPQAALGIRSVSTSSLSLRRSRPPTGLPASATTGATAAVSLGFTGLAPATKYLGTLSYQAKLLSRSLPATRADYGGGLRGTALACGHGVAGSSARAFS